MKRNGWFKANSKVVMRVGDEVLGNISGKGPSRDKRTWLWNDEVQRKVAKRKAKRAVATAKERSSAQLYEELETSKGMKWLKAMIKQGTSHQRTKKGRSGYIQGVKREAKRAVATAKERSFAQLYEELEISKGMKRLHIIAKASEKLPKDLTHVRQIKSSDIRVLRTDIDKLLNEEN
ncbi:uncharacterized protein [Diabrotica undecimpunctata]|uniref:uncharacterized protein n=1 Tax=Diabrotica undecimpunctata TaxID=50387 RepID=UPI003B63C0E0